MMSGVWGNGRGVKGDDEQCEGFGDWVCPQVVHMQEEATTSWEGGLTKHDQLNNLEVETSMVVLATTQGNFGGHST